MRRRLETSPRTLHRAAARALAAVLLAGAGCLGDGGPTEPDYAELPGMYDLVRVGQETLPVEISMPEATGTVVNGVMSVDDGLYYRIAVTVRHSSGRNDVLVYRGFLNGLGGRAMQLVDLEKDGVVWQGYYDGGTVSVISMFDTVVYFKWVRPYQRPA